MTSIDATGRAGGAGATEFRDPAFDPAAVLLALSMQQIGIMQQVAITQAGGLAGQAVKIGSLAGAASTAPAVRQQITADEMASVETVRSQLSAVGGRFNENELTAGDLAELAELQDWAKQRGLDFGDFTTTKTIPAPKSDSAETIHDNPLYKPADGEAAEAPPPPEEPPKTITVLDGADVDAALAQLQNYASEVVSGSANNAALRSLFTDSAAMADLKGQLRSLGFTGDLKTLADLDRAPGEIMQMVGTALDRLTESTRSLRTVTEQIGEKSATVKEHLETKGAQESQIADLDALEIQLKKQKMTEDLRRALAAVQEELASVIAAITSQTVSEGSMKAVMAALSGAQRSQLDGDLSAWTQVFTAQFPSESETPATGHNSNAALRRNYM